MDFHSAPRVAPWTRPRQYLENAAAMPLNYRLRTHLEFNGNTQRRRNAEDGMNCRKPARAMRLGTTCPVHLPWIGLSYKADRGVRSGVAQPVHDGQPGGIENYLINLVAALVR